MNQMIRKSGCRAVMTHFHFDVALANFMFMIRLKACSNCKEIELKHRHHSQGIQYTDKLRRQKSQTLITVGTFLGSSGRLKRVAPLQMSAFAFRSCKVRIIKTGRNNYEALSHCLRRVHYHENMGLFFYFSKQTAASSAKCYCVE